MPFAIYCMTLGYLVKIAKDCVADLGPFYQIDNLYIPLVYAGIVVEDGYQHQGCVCDQAKLRWICKLL